MRRPLRCLALPALAIATTGSLVSVPGAAAGEPPSRAPVGAVYVESNEADANRVLAYTRAADGSLRYSRSYDTGGRGTGRIRTSSQGPVTLARHRRFLLVTNQASDDVSVFRVRHGGRLELTDREPSGGVHPFSVAERRGLVYVLNNGDEGVGNISGFRLGHDGDLTELPGSTRALSAPGSDPAQVGFAPDGRNLVVTEKMTNRIDTFSVSRDGYATGPVVHDSAGVTPFGFEFTRRGVFVVTDATEGIVGKATASSYSLTGPTGLTTLSGAVPDLRSEVCWTVIHRNQRFAYVTNFGDGTISSYTIARDGTIALHESIAARTSSFGELSIRDAGLTRSGRYLYAIDIRARAIFGWRVEADGDLRSIGSAGGLPVPVAGLAAS